MAVDTQYLMNEALTLHQKGDTLNAEKLYLQILEKSPENTDALNLLGLVQIQTENFEQAILYLEKAIALKPSAYFYENLGIAYFNLKNYDESIKSYQKSLEISPNSFDVLFNLALTYKNNGQFKEAIESYEKASFVDPKSPDVYFNLGNIYERMNNTEKALEYYQKANDNKIDYKGINYFLGVSHLKLKNFEEGWKYYEGRPSKEFAIFSQSLVYKDLMAKKPLWNGEDIKDKTLFIYYDSALGDTLMYARYLPMLKKLCKKLLFKPQYCFIDLFEENNYGAEIIGINTLPNDVIFDIHIPIMSVPYLLNLNKEEDIPLTEGYLKPNFERTEEYKQKYFDTDKFKIGIKWMGNPTYDVERIIPIEMFYKLFELKNTQFYSLQKGDGIEEFKKIPKGFSIVDLGETFNNFTDTAAAIENLDLVICNDTSVAHLAGAMGKECWVLLPFVQNWRWHNDLSYSPWYKRAKLFKQSEPNNWDYVFENVYKELSKII